MILHKYLDQCYNILSDLELKVSITSDLNDPFEFAAAYPEELNSTDIKKYLEFFQKRSNLQINLDSSIAKLKEKKPELIQQLIKSNKDTANENVRLISFSSEF